MQGLVKSPEIFKRSTSFRKKIARFMTKNTGMSNKSNFVRNKSFSCVKETQESQIAIQLDESFYEDTVISDTDSCKSGNSLLNRSISSIRKSKRAIRRSISKSNDELRNHFSKIKVQECLPVSYDLSCKEIPILASRESCIDDFIIWEEEIEAKGRFFICI
jgi:hypothetical protein